MEVDEYLFEYQKKQSNEVNDSQLTGTSRSLSTEIVAASTDIKSSRFVIDGRSNSIPGERTDGDHPLLEEKPLEIIYTSFNEILNREKAPVSGTSVSLDREKQILEASQGILSPHTLRPSASISASRLNDLVANPTVKPRSLPLFGGSKRPKINLDAISDEESEIPTVQRSLVVLQEDVLESWDMKGDLIYRTSKKTKGKPKAKPKTGSRSRAKSTRSRKK